ncbi:2,4-dienoyl-CoA reductase [Filimonas lacunae]|uniref:2,4-dienoyl-CoA reductase n=1 Tax=Filimonas lacunae TaxID=477680 RepID=A0A173MGM9_9BACT|nr:NADH:flavin oxidoreductase/NADH oxidase [Filimonas lacunae]BAV06581.1 NADH:flavin oxidoreductases, Old Yellow Enzyme family [Filimonas lacunae]SIT27467.1 2,4-dienoyl-CoA reductase [Filimonas lacunae]
MSVSKLLSPFAIRGTVFKNRIVIAPMCQYSATDGFANDWHLVHLGSRATGGAALIIQEATAVSPEGRITANDLGLWKDGHIAKLQQIVNFLHSQGALAGIQLAHAGRKASCVPPFKGGAQLPSSDPEGWKTLGPSPIAFKDTQEPPAALDEAGIRQVINDFVSATKRAREAGYDVVEIHGAHGYLLHQFYSPISNQRTDEYGGSFENRVKLLLEITRAVKKEWGNEKPLFVRISATDWTEGGWTIEDSVRLATLLKEAGADVIDTSTGGNVSGVHIPLKPGYQVEFAARIRKEAAVTTGAVGLITSPQQAEEILVKEEADLILIARESLRNPNFPLLAAAVLQDEIHWPEQYDRAKPIHV